MADHSRCFRPATRPADSNKKNKDIFSILPTESHDSSCNLSTSWIDLDTSNDTQTSFESKEERIRGDIPIVVDDLYFVDPGTEIVGDERNAPWEGSTTATGGEKCRQSQQHTQHDDQQSFRDNIPNQENPSNAPKFEEGNTEQASDHPYVEIIDTHCETVEGYDWEGILDLRKRMKKLQQQQHQQGVTAVRWVTEFRLYLTDGLLEEATEEASMALDDAPRYEILDGITDEMESRDFENRQENLEHVENDGDDFVEFVESKKSLMEFDAKASDGSTQHDAHEDEEYASLALSPLDVLTNSLLGTRAFHERHHRHHQHFLRLTELIVGGPSLKFGEASIERLVRALACGSALKKLVLIVSAVDLPVMVALGDCFRATSNSLEDFHFYASQTTERLVASRHRYKRVPAPSVLGPGISSWVDAWTSNSNNVLRSLNLSRMDVGDEAAFALSRLLLAAPRLTALNVAQDDFYGRSASMQDVGEETHPPLSFAGTKRLLESLILIEDIKKRSLSSPTPSPLTCSNLLELDLSGWILEDAQMQKSIDGRDDDDDDDRAVDNFYDDYNYTDDGGGDDFEFTEEEKSTPNAERIRGTRRNQRATCVIASMLRVNTTLRKLVLVAEDGSTETNSSSGLEATSGPSRRSFLSVRSTLAIARALRDHVSIMRGGGRNGDGQGRPLGSNLRTLVLSTNYAGGTTRAKSADASSWAIAERKRAVARVFYHALKNRPVHQVRLQELSCTLTFKGLEPLGGAGGPNSAAGHDGSDGEDTSSQFDLRDQLEFVLKQNRAINHSLKSIDSVWLPRLSSLHAKDASDIIDEEEEDDDCQFVEVIDEHADPTTESLVVRQLSRKKKAPPPVLVLALPVLLAKAGREAASRDVTFSCAKILATRTNIWQVTAENRCEPQPVRSDRKFKGTVLQT